MYSPRLELMAPESRGRRSNHFAMEDSRLLKFIFPILSYVFLSCRHLKSRDLKSLPSMVFTMSYEFTQCNFVLTICNEI